MIFFGQLFLVDVWLDRLSVCVTFRVQNDGKAAASFSSVPFSSRYQLNRITLAMVFPFSRKNHDQEAFRLLTWPLWYYDRFVCLSFFFHAPGISGTRVCESKCVFSGFGPAPRERDDGNERRARAGSDAHHSLRLSFVFSSDRISPSDRERLGTRQLTPYAR